MQQEQEIKMNVKEFLKHTRNIEKVYDKTEPQFNHIFYFYEEIVDHILVDRDTIPKLLIVETSQSENIYLIFKGENYILLSTFYIKSITHFTTSLVLGNLNPTITKALNNNFKNNQAFVERLNSSKKIHDDVFESIYKYDKKNKSIDERIKETCSLFIIAHELSHFRIHKVVEVNLQEDFFKWDFPFELKMIDDAVKLLYEKNGIFNWITDSNSFREETYCDRIAVIKLWKYLIFRVGDYNPILLNIILIACMKSIKIMYLIDSKSKVSKRKIQELHLREIMLQKHVIGYYINYAKLVKEDTYNGFKDPNNKIYEMLEFRKEL